MVNYIPVYNNCITIAKQKKKIFAKYNIKLTTGQAALIGITISSTSSQVSVFGLLGDTTVSKTAYELFKCNRLKILKTLV